MFTWATISPSISSTGYVIHHPMTAVRKPESERMFQNAFVVRSSLSNIETIGPPGPSVLPNPRMPCRAGAFPVATVVQMIGENVGSMLFSRPACPSRSRRVIVGSSPARASGRS